MIHAITLGLFLVLVVHDALLGSGVVPVVGGVSVAGAASIAMLPPAVLWLVVHAFLVRAGRRLDRSGSARSLRMALLSLGAARVAVLVMFGVAVLGFGWLSSVRAAVGDLVLVDEAAAMAPPLAALVLLWWSYYGFARRRSWPRSTARASCRSCRRGGSSCSTRCACTCCWC